MRLCAEFEHLLDESPELAAGERERIEAHLAACPTCRTYAEDLVRLDADLVAAFARVRPSRGFQDAALRTIRRQPRYRNSALPEVLDFIGWAAVVAVVASLVFFRFMPR